MSRSSIDESGISAGGHRAEPPIRCVQPDMESRDGRNAVEVGVARELLGIC